MQAETEESLESTTLIWRKKM